METELKNIVDALKQVAEKLGERSTKESVLEDREKPVDPFEKTEDKQKRDDYKIQADILAEAHFKAREKYDKKNKAPRKVVDDAGKKAVINNIKSVGVVPPSPPPPPPPNTTNWGLIGSLLIGAGALVLGTITAIVEFFKTIGKSKTFIWLTTKGKGAIQGIFRMIAWPFRVVGGALMKVFDKARKSNWFKSIKNFFNPVRNFFTGIGARLKNLKIGNMVSNLNKSVSGFFTGASKNVKGLKTTPQTTGLFTSVKNFFTKLGANIKKSKPGQIVSNMLKPVTSFFNNLGTKIRNFKTGKLVDNMLKPVTNFFSNLKTSITKSIKNFKIGNVGTFLKGIFTGTPGKPGIFGKIRGVFTMIKDFVMKSPALKGAVKFGKTIGKVLGKIFFPITLLMGVFDGVTGFMEGYKKGGIIGGIKGAVIGVFDGLVGGIVRMAEGAAKWVAEKLGLKNFAKVINISGFLQPIYDMFGGAVDFVVGLFTFDEKKIKAGFKDFFGGTLDLAKWFIDTPINAAANLIKDVFKIGDPDKPFVFSEWVSEKMDAVIGMITKPFEAIMNWDAKKYVRDNIKKLPGGEKLYDMFFGEEEKMAAAQEAEAKALSGNLMSKVSDKSAINKIIQDTQAAGVAAGGDTYEERVEKMQEDIADAVRASRGTAKSFESNLNAETMKKLLNVAKYQGVDVENEQARAAFFSDFAKMHGKTRGRDTVSKEGKEHIHGIAMQSAGLELGSAKTEAGVAALLDHVKKTGSVQLGGAMIPLKDGKIDPKQLITEPMLEAYKQLTSSKEYGDQLYLGMLDKIGLTALIDKQMDNKMKEQVVSPQAKSMINNDKSKQSVSEQLLGPRGQGRDLLGPSTSDQLLGPPRQLRFSRDVQEQFDRNPPLSQEEFKIMKKSSSKTETTESIEETGGGSTTRVSEKPQYKPLKTRGGATRGTSQSRALLDDFVWRPGADAPLSFNKGDLLMGIHEESAKRIKPMGPQGSPSVDNKQLIDKVEDLATIMQQHSQIHQETLKTLKENGMQTATSSSNVMGNNSNNTTINNIQQDQSIMEFRDRTIGRLSR